MTAPTNYDGDRDHDQDRDEDHFTIRDVVASYNAGAPTLAPRYEGLPFEEVHASVRSESVPDVFGRDGIAWEVIWLRLPVLDTRMVGSGLSPQPRPQEPV